MRASLLLLLSLVVGCGARVDDNGVDVPGVEAPACAITEPADIELHVRRLEPVAMSAMPEPCSGDQITVVDHARGCTLRTATSKALCDERTTVHRGSQRFVAQGPGLLPTLNADMGFYGTEGVWYLVAALSTSFLTYLPAFDEGSAAAVVAVNEGEGADYCAVSGVTAAVVDHPEAIVRYVGGGAAVGATPFIAIEGVAPGQVVTVRLSSAGCGSLDVPVRLERGLVSLTAGWVRRSK